MVPGNINKCNLLIPLRRAGLPAMPELSYSRLPPLLSCRAIAGPIGPTRDYLASPAERERRSVPTSKETKVIFPLAPESAMMMMREEEDEDSRGKSRKERKIKGKCCQLHRQRTSLHVPHAES